MSETQESEPLTGLPTSPDVRPSTEHRALDEFDAWSMVESSPDGMLLADEHGSILLVNIRIEELFGYQRCELVGRRVEELLPERYRRAHLAHRSRYRAAPVMRAMGEGMTLAGRRKDGTEFPVEVSLSPVDRDGTLRVVATVRDISDRLAIEAHAHAVLDTVDAASDGVFMFPADSLQFAYVNQGAVQQLGYTEAELLTMTPPHIDPEFTRRSFLQMIEPLVTGTIDSHTFTTVHRRKDGVDVPVEIILEYPAPRREGDPRLLVALVRDITIRVEAERAYHRSAEAFRAAFDNAPVAIGVATIDGEESHLLQVNQAYCELLGYSTEELVALSMNELVHPDDRAILAASQAQALGGEATTGSFEIRLVRADGGAVPVWVHGKTLETEPNQPTTVLAHIIDLSERQQADAERERSRLWMEGLAEIRAAVLDERPLDEIMTILCCRARILTDADNAFVTHPDHDRERHWVGAVDRPETREFLPESFVVDGPARRALAGETFIVTDLDSADAIDPANRAAVRSRSERPTSGLMVPFATGADTALLFVTSDTEAAFDEDAVRMIEGLATEATTAMQLHHARRQQAKLALLEDRERLARDLHDVVIQRLFGAGMGLQSVLPFIDDEVAAGRVEEVVGELDDAINELRSAIFHLTASAPTGATVRLAEVVAEARAPLGFEPTVTFAGDPESIPGAVLEQLLPSLTEALSNVARHAEATEVMVTVSYEPGRTVLSVVDNGVGMDSAAVRGNGLANLADRAERLGGTCTVVGQPGTGTTLTWTALH